MDPLSIASSFASVLGGLATASWQNSTSKTLDEIQHELGQLENQMLQVIDILRDLYQYILHTDEDMFKRYINGEINSDRLTFSDMVANLSDPLHPSQKERQVFEDFGIHQAANHGYSLYVWGAITYPSAAQSVALALACFKIAQSKSSLIDSVIGNFLTWLQGQAVNEFGNAQSSFDSIYTSKKSVLDSYPKKTWLGQELDRTAGDSNSDEEECTNWYCDISSYSFDNGLPTAENALDSDSDCHTNPRGWPLASGFGDKFPSNTDPTPLVNQNILSPLNTNLIMAKNALNSRNNAINHSSAILAIAATVVKYKS